MDRIDIVEHVAEESGNDMLQSTESRLKKIEDRPVAIEDIQQRLEVEVDQLKWNMNEPVVQAVQEALQDDKAEEAEMQREKTNNILS